MPMQFRGLMAFCAAARLASFKDAADELCVSASAVSHQIRGLEEYLGVKLFERETRSIALTQQGRAYFEEIDPLIRSIQAVTQRVREHPDRTQLRVQMPEFFASELFIPRVGEFSSRHEDLDLRIESLGPADVPRSGADLSIILAGKAPEGETADRLFPIRYVPACSAALYDGLSKRGLDALEESTLMLHQARPHAWHQWAEVTGVPAPNPRQVIRVDSMFALARAAEQGAGIALIPMPISTRWFETGSIRRLFSTDLITSDFYHLITSGETGHPDAARRLREWIVNTFRDYG